MNGVSLQGKAVGMLSRIRWLLGILIGSLRLGAPKNPSPWPFSTDDNHMMIQSKPPAELVDDAIAEILFRLPPEEPANFFSASLVSKRWRYILFDSAFNHHYREFHRAPPLVGFFHNVNYAYTKDSVPRFVATTTTAFPFSPSLSHFKDSWILDSRHGRVLIIGTFEKIIVRDLITNRQKQLPQATNKPRWIEITGAVLCAQAGCNHLNCHEGPFHVVFLGNNYSDGAIWARVYSSETNAWGMTMTTTVNQFFFIDRSPSLLIRDALYFITEHCDHKIIKYDLARQRLFTIDVPRKLRGIVVMVEDDRLGFASIEGYDLFLWSLKAGVEGSAEWAQPRVIRLKKLLPFSIPLFSLEMIGFEEITCTIFVSTRFAVFALELQSQRVRKVSKRKAYSAILPYTSFYTPDMLRSNRRFYHEKAIDH